METIKLTYFNLPARGECIRLLLAYGEKDFEDVKFQTDDLAIWNKNKNQYPFSKLPVYEENGRVTHQTVAILRYLGKKFGLIGNDDWENLEIDAIADTFTDFTLKVVDYHYEPSANEKEKKGEILFRDVVPIYLDKFNEIAKESGGYLALKRLTWVDFYLAGFIDYLSWMMDLDIFEIYPNIKDVQNNVFSLPAVRNWYNRNPMDIEPAKRWIKKSGTPMYE